MKEELVRTINSIIVDIDSEEDLMRIYRLVIYIYKRKIKKER